MRCCTPGLCRSIRKDRTRRTEHTRYRVAFKRPLLRKSEPEPLPSAALDEARNVLAEEFALYERFRAVWGPEESR